MEDLERRANGEGGNFWETAVDLTVAAAAIVGGYNLSGAMLDHSDLSGLTQEITTAGVLAGSGFIGYNVRTVAKKVASLFESKRKKLKRELARSRALLEISRDPEFQERQGLQQGSFGPVRKALKYALTVPAGGALGYFPGAAGILPLCVYFGNNFKWSVDASLGSGPWAGAAMGAWAFGEMAHKGQYRRMVTTAATLGGVIGGHFLTAATNLKVYESKPDLYAMMSIDAAYGAAAGLMAYKAYDFISSRVKKGRDRGVEKIDGARG